MSRPLLTLTLIGWDLATLEFCLNGSLPLHGEAVVSYLWDDGQVRPFASASLPAGFAPVGVDMETSTGFFPNEYWLAVSPTIDFSLLPQSTYCGRGHDFCETEWGPFRGTDSVLRWNGSDWVQL